MSMTVLRAKYKIENIVANEGYIIIESQSDGSKKIEGIFTFDYCIFNFTSSKSFDLILYERLFSTNNHSFSTSIKTTIYQSQTLYNNELYCPDEYSLFSETDVMHLSLIERVNNMSKIKDVCNQLCLLRN